MAPPGNRRTGYSRRAQYNTFFAYVAGVVGILAGGFFLIGSIASPASYEGLRSLASDATAPVMRLVTGGRSAASGAWNDVSGYAASGAEVARLRREVQLARVAAIQAQAQADENRRLKALLQLHDEAPRPVTNAWLIAGSNSSTRRFATISAGRAQGVQPGMPVRSPIGLVGRVLEVGHHSARILLITDTESVVPVRRASDGLPGFATGRADGTVQLRLITLGVNPLRPGDTFVTSGSGGIYWPGTPIAVVSTLTRDGAIAHVLSAPAASEMVVVQPAWQPTADDSLPPPANTTPADKRKP
ncbi:rod shape-determining protein MreC [Novosphingobium sp. FSY-8]|uniref:Cell shape-determining protein MreC n=1 Tax=Novosphingobium ovatum TaxID=1908523 RepID=A0ABW9XCW4_9SPHN|nr:rod shape-determining protein MreC [Novosphingobium ovatum]NBC36317.1 rod shape-determining protein MreC [Novosphingobium ovatum]